MRRGNFFVVLLVLSVFLGGMAPNVFAAITWQFNYIDPGSQVGFFSADPVVQSQRRNALETSAAAWGQKFNHIATIQIDVTSSEDANSTTLASANGATHDPNTPGFGQQQVIRNKVLTGNDLNGTTSDGSVDVNWGVKWETSADRADVDNTEFDFRSTMYHELNHALGFGSAILQNGLDIYNTLVGNPGTWDLFDKFISDVNGTAIIDPATFILNGPAWNQHSEGGASPGAGLFFNGEAAVAANGGNPVGLYTPTTWEDGSSVSHTDDENSAFNNSMMIANTDIGPGSRDMSAIEIGIMKDLGYDVVPLPSAIMLLGPALFGLAMIRRRKK